MPPFSNEALSGRKIVGVCTSINEEILLLKRNELEGVKFPGYWSVVTGDVEAGESPFHAASRELFEETGFETNSWNLKYLYNWYDDRFDFVFYLYKHTLSKKINPVIDFEHTDYKYIKKNELDSISPMDLILKKNLKSFI
ncbi:MAG: 8-oxo-dGTP pyrophosphatase MutT (NUDIX family) [Bacteriovoracaceae bacterium]|jgi:8-oxo-dGTP pyrophosphatase MutT (NUDIX family)